MLTIIPYYEYNGAMTVPDSRMLDLAELILDEKNNDNVFMEPQVRDATEFLQLFKRNDRKLSYIIRDEENRDIAIFWLENFRGGSAEMGFAIANKRMQLRVFEAGKLALEYIFKIQADGEPAILTVWGICHEDNKKAIRFLETIGLSRLGTMPSAIYDHREDRTVGGVILYKENLPEE